VEAASTSATWLKLEINNLHSLHGPDQRLQRQKRVHRHSSVQQALVLVQIKIRSRFNASLLKNINLDPSGH
jgi:hypothetical protein